MVEIEKTNKMDFINGIKTAFDRMDFIESVAKLNELQPIFYDRSKMWWYWNKEKCNWIMVDEIDVINAIYDELKYGRVIAPGIKSMILDAFKMVGRKNVPMPSKNTWIQFNNTILDIKTAETMIPTPKYFFTNTIPHTVGLSEETPTIDKLFVDWVGEDKKSLLYEICAYCLLPDYPIHRIFCLIGGGSNGKGKFLRMIEKFIGTDNTLSSDLERVTSSRFESGRFYRKLVCFMGETNFRTLYQTQSIKSLTGEDRITGEFKRKDPFDFVNYAKIIIATNSLPPTSDKTMGFYRRWNIIDFSNQFEDGKDIIKTIPEEEYQNLCKKSIRILNEILITGKFSYDVSFEERAKIYEEKSEPMTLFIKENCVEDVNGTIKFWEFFEKLTGFLGENNFRIMSRREASAGLKKRYELKIRNYKNENDEWKSYNTILGLKWKST